MVEFDRQRFYKDLNNPGICQSFGALSRGSQTQFCALGLIIKQAEEAGLVTVIPATNFADELDYYKVEGPSAPYGHCLPPSIAIWAGLRDVSGRPSSDSGLAPISEMNDDRRTLPEIAKIIEENESAYFRTS